jgi:hypothetical protein
MSLRILKIVQNALHYGRKPSFCFNFFEKPQITSKKASILLKTYLKSPAIFEKPSH